MRLKFSKMHGLGNDFVVLDAYRQPLALPREHIRRLADRHFGIGCDQVLVVEPPISSAAAFRYRIFNANGDEVEQCGNGARCFARYVVDHGYTQLADIPVETAAGLIHLQLTPDGLVTVDMGTPRFAPADIPFLAEAPADRYTLTVDGATVEIGAVSVGNPHAVLTVPDVDTAPVATLGPALESHSRFPQRVNVGFMQILAPDHLRLRVYERGVGETLACGTGACAAVIVGQRQHHLATQVKVDLRGGQLIITWPGPAHSVRMTGPAAYVFEGTIEL